MIRFFRSLYFNSRFFYLIALLVVLFVVSYIYPFVYAVTSMLCLLFAALCILDLFLLYHLRTPISAKRVHADRFSNGDLNSVRIQIENNYPFTISLQVIDEIPEQFQFRNFSIYSRLNTKEQKNFVYELKPTQRGEYSFGCLNVFARSLLALVERRFECCECSTTKVYPSFIQMRKYELMAISDRLTEVGIKKVRRISRNNEFEQIRDYVQGDDMRIINWKATARQSKLMVNQYLDEKSQQVFCIIDKGRTMKMPFDGMSLLDYAINAALVISNIALLKQDKAGLITYSVKIDQMLPADRKNNQINTILDALYSQQTDFLESNNELLYATIRQKVRQRSLLMLFTNFEGLSSMLRQLPMFIQLEKNHLLVIVFFENTEIKDSLNKKASSVEEIYIKTICEKFAREKRQIVKELNKYGIHSILTTPEKLTVDTINKYLQLKALGLI